MPLPPVEPIPPVPRLDRLTEPLEAQDASYLAASARMARLRCSDNWPMGSLFVPNLLTTPGASEPFTNAKVAAIRSAYAREFYCCRRWRQRSRTTICEADRWHWKQR